ncbi:MAG: DUF885 domain-containing protein [Chthoniobacterales bacterium]|nr:DUF885 domain-containing protein [Chthoniobacterales bacterium]
MAIFRTPPGSSMPQLHRAAGAFFRKTWEIFPAEAAGLGLKEYRGHLGRNRPEDHHKHAALLAETLAKIENLPPGEGDDWTDRRAFLAYLRTGLFYGSEHPRWMLDPQTHSGAAANAVFHLLVRHADNLRPVARDILSLVREIPRFLDEGFACLRRPVPLWTGLAARSSVHAAQFIEETAKQIVPLCPSPRAARDAFARAADAFRDYARRLGKIKTGPTAGFAVGKTNFEFLLRERMGTDATAGELLAEGRRLVSSVSDELRREAAKFGRRPAHALLEELRDRWQPAEPTLLGEYRRVTTDIKKRLGTAGIVSLPRGEKLKVVPVPDFLREQFPTAAYSAPGAFDADQTGIFWVNDLSQRAATADARRSEIAQHFGLELTCAHEAYPGHHLQFIVQNRHPSHLRRMFSHAIFYEGWTLWCEKLCVEKKIYRAPHARLIQLHDALWRAHRILVDIGLHTGGMTHAAATRHLVENVGFTKARAAADVNWYTAAPTVPMSYLLGRREVEKLFAAHRGSLREFNDRLLSRGAVPFSWFR